jgi:hypothetical protein
MPRRLFGVFSCTIATALILGESGCARSRQIVATVKNAFGTEWVRQLRC